MRAFYAKVCETSMTLRELRAQNKDKVVWFSPHRYSKGERPEFLYSCDPDAKMHDDNWIYVSEFWKHPSHRDKWDTDDRKIKDLRDEVFPVIWFDIDVELFGVPCDAWRQR